MTLDCKLPNIMKRNWKDFVHIFKKNGPIHRPPPNSLKFVLKSLKIGHMATLTEHPVFRKIQIKKKSKYAINQLHLFLSWNFIILILMRHKRLVRVQKSFYDIMRKLIVSKAFFYRFRFAYKHTHAVCNYKKTFCMKI